MRIPLLFAHGEGLISYVNVVLLFGLIGAVSLIVSVIAFFAKQQDRKRTAARSFYVFLGCVAVIFLAPVVIHLLGLP